MKWRENFQLRPLAAFALAAITGIIVAQYLAISVWLLLFLAIGMAVIAWRYSHLHWSMLLTLFVFMGLHQISDQMIGRHPLHDYLQLRTTHLDVVVKGEVEQALRRDLPGSELGETLFHATEITAPSAGKKWSGSTMLRLILDQGTTLGTGEYRIEGWLRLPPVADNPGQFDEREYDQRLGLVAEMRAHQVECLQERRWDVGAMFVKASDLCQQWVKEVLSLNLEDAPKERTVILAMALGANEPGAKEMKVPFRNSGTLHIFAVSGLHVGIVGLVFWMLLKPFGASRNMMLMLLVPALFSYAFITGWRPSAVRAAIMASVFLCGALWHRRADMLNSLWGRCSAHLSLGYSTNLRAGLSIIVRRIGFYRAIKQKNKCTV